MADKKKLVQMMGQIKANLSSKEFDNDYLALKLSVDFETLEYTNNKYFNKDNNYEG